MGKLTFTPRPLPHMLIYDCCWMFPSLLSAQSLDHFLYQNPPPEEGEPPGEPLGILGALCHHLPIGYSLIQASHTIIYITCASKGPDGSPKTLGAAQPPGLHLLLHDSICNSSIAFLHHICSHFHLCFSMGPVNWTCQAESNIPCTCIWGPLFAQSSSREQDYFPWCQDHGFGDSVLETILEHDSN